MPYPSAYGAKPRHDDGGRAANKNLARISRHSHRWPASGTPPLQMAGTRAGHDSKGWFHPGRVGHSRPVCSLSVPGEPQHASQPRTCAGIGLTGDRFGAPVALEGAQDRGERRIEATLRRHLISDAGK
jgi:hypothetical protein